MKWLHCVYGGDGWIILLLLQTHTFSDMPIFMLEFSYINQEASVKYQAPQRLRFGGLTFCAVVRPPFVGPTG